MIWDNYYCHQCPNMYANKTAYQRPFTALKWYDGPPPKDQRHYKCTMPAALFNTLTTRRISDLKAQNCRKFWGGFLVLDIDDLCDIKAAREKLAALPCVAFAGETISGSGLWAVIKAAKAQDATDIDFYKLYQFVSNRLPPEFACDKSQSHYMSLRTLYRRPFYFSDTEPKPLIKTSL